MALKRLFLFIILLTVILLPLFPGGAPEKDLGKDKVKAYIILSRGDSANTLFVERYHLPSLLSSFAWSEFLVNEGVITTKAAGGYRIISKKQFLVEQIGNYTVYGYDLTVNHYSSKQVSSRKTYSFSFSYTDLVPANGALIRQPHSWAITKGINKSGKTFGFVRISKLLYLGNGKFKAEVETG